MRDVRPFYVPPAASVTASPWERFVEDDWEALDDYVEDWDYRTKLRLRCRLEVDIVAVRDATRLPAGTPLAWSIGWRATDTGLIGEPVLHDVDSELAITIDLPPDRVGASVALLRRLVLRSDRLTSRSGEARYAGSILWSDEVVVRLTGRGSGFPTEVVDFKSLEAHSMASWYLDLPAAVDSPAMGSMMLLINAADTALVAAVSRSRRRSDVQEGLVQNLEEGVVEELVRWALAHWDELTDAETDSVGGAAEMLATRVLPDPAAWTGPEVDSMALKAAIVSGARKIGFGRVLR